MSQSNSLTIDAYSHIIPPRYKDRLRVPEEVISKTDPHPTLYNLDHSFEVMDKYGLLF